MKRLLALLLLVSSPAAAQLVSGSGGGASGLVSIGGTGSCCGGATTETNILALKVPGGSMGANGAVDVKCLWGYPNSSNNKTFVFRYGATAGAVSGGSVAAATTVTTTVATQTQVVVRNTATNAQTAYGAGPTVPFGSSATVSPALAIDTTADSYINVNATTASGAETVTVHCTALALRAP